jgi:hypothetical protein
MDGTPVIDLKPYVTRLDQPPGEPRCGWFVQITITDGTTPEQLAPTLIRWLKPDSAIPVMDSRHPDLDSYIGPMPNKHWIWSGGYGSSNRGLIRSRWLSGGGIP